MRISLLLPTWRSRRFTGIGRPGEGTDGKTGDQGDSRSDHPQGTRNFWRSMEASGEPGAGLWSFNAARKPRSRKGSRLTSVRRIGQPGLLRRFELADLGRFSCHRGPHAFCHRDKKGGGGIKSCGGVPAPHSLNSFVLSGVPLLFGFHNDDTEKSEETIATPPKRGVPTGPDSGAEWHASIRPQGVAIVGIYPCGKARKRRPGAARIKRRMGLWNCGRTIGN